MSPAGNVVDTKTLHSARGERLDRAATPSVAMWRPTAKSADTRTGHKRHLDLWDARVPDQALSSRIGCRSGAIELSSVAAG
jgi:hypothetical protein